MQCKPPFYDGCNCPNHAICQGIAATFYPTSHIWQIGRRFFRGQLHGDPNYPGLHLVRAMCNAGRIQQQRNGWFEFEYLDRAGVVSKLTPIFLHLRVRRIQRWLRHLRRTQRKLAVAMAMHPRLGQNASLLLLDADVLETVLRFL